MAKPGKLRDLRATALLPAAKPARRGPALRQVPVQPPATPPSRPLRLSRVLDSLAMRAGRRLVMRIAGNIFEIAFYAAIAIGVGLASAWYMMDYGSRLTVERDGPWQRWTMAGAEGADPYTKAHFARAGWLPLSTAAAHYFLAGKDSSGEALYADCEYVLNGAAPAGRRWTLAAFDLQGRPVEPGLGRPVITSANALPGPEASLTVHLGQSTAPGNWLSLTGAARMQLLLTVYGRIDRAVKAGAAEASRRPLPNIVRTGCR